MFQRGSCISNQFIILSELGKGSFGQVYEVFDILQSQTCALKIMNNQSLYEQEKAVYQHANDAGISGIPKIFGSGTINESYYIAMEKMGLPLSIIALKRGQQFSDKTIIQIGIQLIWHVKSLHNLGFVHCDLKFDNIMLRSSDFSNPLSSCLSIIDFGGALPYLNENGDHVKKESINDFHINFPFASISHMEGDVQSRKNDIISILYMMIYLKEGTLPWAKGPRAKEMMEHFSNVRRQKYNFHHEISKPKNQTNVFRRLLVEAYSLKFQEEPKYEDYIRELMNEMNVSKDTLDFKMDWNKNTVHNIDPSKIFNFNAKKDSCKIISQGDILNTLSGQLNHKRTLNLRTDQNFSRDLFQSPVRKYEKNPCSQFFNMPQYKKSERSKKKTAFFTANLTFLTKGNLKNQKNYLLMSFSTVRVQLPHLLIASEFLSNSPSINHIEYSDDCNVDEEDAEEDFQEENECNKDKLKNYMFVQRQNDLKKVMNL